MKKFKKLLGFGIVAILAVLLTAMPVFAAAYSASYTILETSGNAYDMLGVSASVDNQYLADNGYVEADALDTRIETAGGTEQPHMIVDDRTLAAVKILAVSQTNLYFTTGNSDQNLSIITGHDGYLTISDSPDLEPGNNFEFEFDGYVDTSAGSDKNLLFKEGAFQIYVSAAGDITGEIQSTEIQSLPTGGSTLNAEGVSWLGQTFEFTNSVSVGAITISIKKVGTPAGNLTVTLNTSAGNVPTSTILASVSVSASTISTVQGDVTFTFASSVALVGGTRYAIAISVPAGTGANRIEWFREAGGGYVNGAGSTSGNSGVNWTPGGWDMRFTVVGSYADAAVTATGVASGEYVVLVTADTTDLKIFIDAVEEDSVALAGASITDNGNDWIINQNNVLPYMVSYNHTVSGALVTRYEPNTMILGAILPDREAAGNDATITFGTNPAGVAVVLGGLVSAGQPVAGDETDIPPVDILPAGGSDWFIEPDVSGTLLTNPLRPFVTMMSDTTTINELQAWRLLALAFILAVTVGAIRSVRGHLLIAGIASGSAIGLAVAWTIFPLWALVFAIGAILGGLISERSPSL